MKITYQDHNLTQLEKDRYTLLWDSAGCLTKYVYRLSNQVIATYYYTPYILNIPYSLKIVFPNGKGYIIFDAVRHQGLFTLYPNRDVSATEFQKSLSKDSLKVYLKHLI